MFNFHLGFQESTHPARSYLESIPSEEIVNKLGFMSFRPIIDGRFIRDSAVNLYKSRTVNTVDFLMGCNSHEGALFTLGPLRPKGFGNLEEARDLVRWMVELYFWDSVKDKDSLASALVDEYLLSRNTQDFSAVEKGMVELVGDIMFVIPMIHIADLHSGRNLYLSCYKIFLNVSQTFPIKKALAMGKKVHKLLG